MTRRLPSASALERAFRCLASAVLPRSGRRTQWMDKGTDVHAYLEAVNRLGAEAALAAIQDPRTRAVCSIIDLSALPVDPSRYAAEVKYAFDVETGRARELPGRGGDRDYSAATPMEMCGTADVVGLVGESGVIVPDYKGAHADLPSPEEHRQGRFLVLAAARAHGRTEGVFEIIRLGDDGRPWKQRATFDAFDLAEIAEQLRDLARRIMAVPEGVSPPTTLGSHCVGCQSIDYCPAQNALLRASKDDPDGQLAVIDDALASGRDTFAYELWKAHTALHERIEDAVKARAQTTPIRLSDGRLYGLQDENRTTIYGDKTWHYLREKFGEPKAWELAEIKITQERLKDLAGETAAAGGGKKTRIFEAMLDELCSIGAANRRPMPKLKVFKPGKDGR